MANDDRETDLLLRWQEIRDQGTNCTPEELCADCPELLDSVKREIEKLKRLEAVRTGAIDFDAAPPVVNGYEILGVLGQGGMGVVYQARHVQLNRLVALKMLRAGRHAAWQELHRFRTETEAVARVQHPNIVQIHDVGEAEGQPYFAMEFVGGGTLAKKLAGTPLSARQGADLVEFLARAVHTAHERGILHRDLKPTNVLLTGEGVPKITDFGLARFLDVEAGRTQTGAVLGTPAYMAPEQAAGQTRQLTPAVDVYAVGAILYELLTGRPPFKAATALETLDLVRTQEPVPPRRLQPRVPRDLDTICLQCLQKEPKKRYATALALADDLRRFGNGEPIRAKPVPAWAQAWKWAKRRPALASLLGVCLVAALGLSVATVALAAANRREQQARAQADQNLRLAREAVDKTVTKIAGNALLHQANFHQLRHELLEYLVPFYEEFVKQRGTDPDLEAERGRAWHRLAHLRDEMGESEKARSDYEHMRAIFAQLAAEFPAVPEYRRDLARSQHNLAVVLQELGKPAEAETAYRDGLKIQAQLAQEFPAVALYRLELARSHNSLGNLLNTVGKRADAKMAYREAQKIQAQLTEEFPAELEYRQELAKSHNNLAIVQFALGNRADAETDLRQALSIQAQLAQDFPTVTSYRHDVARSYTNMGNLLRALGKPADAETSYRDGLKIYAQLAQDFPAVPQYRQELSAIHNNLGLLLVDQRKLDEAERSYGEALKIRARLAQDFPAVSDYRNELAGTMVNQAILLRHRTKPDLARRLLEEAIPHHQAALQGYPDNPVYRKVFRTNRGNLAEILAELGEPEAAAQIAEELIRAAVDPAGDLYAAASIFARCVPLVERNSQLAEAQRKEQAQAYSDRALATLRQAIQNGYQDAEHMKKDTELEPVRSQPEFQQILRELESRMKVKTAELKE